MKQLIDRKEIFDLLDEDYGYWEYVRMLINEHGLDDYEDAVLRVADGIRETIEDIVESMPVVEERKSTICNCYTTMPGDYPIYQYFCGECSEWVESNMDDEEYKFCPYCGAQYERIVKYD